jgi:hypothetical protein
VIGQLTGKDAGPFVIDGSDWFELSGARSLGAVRSALDATQQRLRAWSPTSDRERLRHRSTVGSSFDLVLGAGESCGYTMPGQIQLIR